jgi:hypothetical protein
MKLQKVGGYAAIGSVCFSIISGILRGLLADWTDVAKTMAAFSARPTHFVVLYQLSITGSILTFVMFLALHERMHAAAVYLTRIMLIAASASIIVDITSFMVLSIGGEMTIVPAPDVSAFRALLAVGLSLRIVGGHHTYGWACLLLGATVLKTHLFSRILGWLFLFLGVLGILTSLVPQLGQLTVIAFLMSGVTTVWIGIALLRQKQPQPAVKQMAAAN